MATLRPLLLRTLHLSGVKSIDAEALAMFDAYISDRSGSPLPVDLRYKHVSYFFPHLGFDFSIGFNIKS